jgi:L-ascorbate metabolism protein UlaG (beta-lactamase superfamily)
MDRRFRIRVLLACACSAAVPWLVRAQDVTITPLGAADGEFCVGDRALLFEDPTGVRVLAAPGRTVRGSADPRLPAATSPAGGVHVVLIDHPHTDHIGDVHHDNCAGNQTSPFAFPGVGNAPEIAARHHSVMPVGGEMSSYFAQKIRDVTGVATPSCPVVVASGTDNNITVPRASACVQTLRGGNVQVVMSGQSTGVRIVTIPAFHASGAPAGLVDENDLVPPGLTGYMGAETGYILQFSNGLTVLWTGDSGLIGDWATQSAFYRPGLAVVHMDGLFTMGPKEAAFAVNQLIRPRTVIPEHANQVSTMGGAVVGGTRVQAFMDEVHGARVVVPLSGRRIFCNGHGDCHF